MDGFYAPAERDPQGDDAAYRALETRGRPDLAVNLELDLTCPNLAEFIEDLRHRMEAVGKVRLRLPGDVDASTYGVRGYADLFVPRYKPYGIPPSDTLRRDAQGRLAAAYTTQVGAPESSERFLRYELRFDERPEWRLEGYKRVRDDPGLEAWRDTSTLFIKLLGPPGAGAPTNGGGRHEAVRGAGVIRVELFDFLFRQLPSINAIGTKDAARASWAIAKFTAFFFGSLQRVYSPDTASLFDTLFRGHPSNVKTEPHRRRQSLGVVDGPRS
jgi:hypothetical protein